MTRHISYRFTVADTRLVHVPGKQPVEAVISQWSGVATIIATTPGPWAISDIALEGELADGSKVLIPLAMTDGMHGRLALAIYGQCKAEIDALWAKREAA